MDTNPKEDLKDAEKKLTDLRKRLQCLMQIVYGSRNVDSDDVLNAVKELQSLFNWAAQKQDIWSQDAKLLLQMQGLQNIQQSLESATDKVETAKTSVPCEATEPTEGDECVSRDLLSCNTDAKRMIDENGFPSSDQQNQFESSSVAGNAEKTSPDDNRLISDGDNINFNIKVDGQASDTESSWRMQDDDDLSFLTNGIKTLLRSNQEMKELLEISTGNITESSETSSTTGLLQSPFSDLPDLLSNDMQDFESSIDEVAMSSLTNNTPERCDVLLDDEAIKAKREITSKSNLNFITDSKVIGKTSSNENITSKRCDDKLLQNDTEGKWSNSETDSKDIFFNNLDMHSEFEMQEGNGAKLKNNIVESVSINDCDSQSQPNKDLNKLLLTECSMVYNEDSFANCNFTTERSLKANSENKESLPSDKEADTILIDLLTSDDFSRANNEEERCRTPCLVPCTTSVGREVMVLEAHGDDKAATLISDPQITKDPLDICMFAIRNLYDNLRAKENEILKMSVIQNDQKHIEALQTVILNFHKEITNLNAQLDKATKETSSLKEQVLELEEAENDARSKAQKLEKKLSFLQEKDLHSQSEINLLKKNLKTASDQLAEKEALVKELRSQVANMENLVKQYQDHIKELESDQKPETESLDETLTFEKGTQTYPFLTNLDRNVFNSSNGSALPEERSPEFQDSQTKTVIAYAEQSKDATNSEDPYVITVQDGDILKEFNNRLHTLMQEDTNLQEQIHNVDLINLSLWKKLQNLENNIGECQKQNIDDTNTFLTVAEGTDVFNISSDSSQEKQDASSQKADIPSDDSFKDNDSNNEKSLLMNGKNEFLQDKGSNSSEKVDSVHKEWKTTEKQLLSDFQQLATQKDNLVQKIQKLVVQKDKFEQQVALQQAELNELKEKNRKEVSKLRAEQENVCATWQHKVNQLIAEEKDLLKMIKNRKSERGNRNQAEAELERLKCSYIQLQLELSNSREEKRRLEKSYEARIDACVCQYKEVEARLIKELERQRQDKMTCDKNIKDHQLQQQQLSSALNKKEQELRLAREIYEKSLKEAKQQYQSAETELKSELIKLEEKTNIATAALVEERLRVEKELQEDIDQLRTKEESYLHKISDLETNMIKLQEELNKVTQTTKNNMDDPSLHVSRASQKCDKAIKHTPGSSKPNLLLDRYMDARPISETESKLYSRETEKGFHMTSSPKQHQLSTLSNKNTSDKDENVENLRSQVRELQAQLEKISEEGTEVPSASACPAKDAASMGWHRKDVEVDERKNEWKKDCTSSAQKNICPQNRPAYENRYPSRYNYQSDKQKKQTERKSVEENDYDEILPRPTNFHLVQQVGPDALLVGWSYVNSSFLEGFEIYLDNRLHERIYIPDRTKALVSGLNLRKSFTLSIRAVSHYGQLSEPATLELTYQQPQTKSEYFEEDDDEYSDTESSRHRPYSMEW